MLIATFRLLTASLLQNTLTKTGHKPLWEEVKFIDRDNHWYARKMKEAIHTRLNPNNINKDKTALKNVCACVRLTLSGAFSIVWSMKVFPLEQRCSCGDFLAITTFDKMELDEFSEQSNSTRSLWHTQHFMRWVVSCTKTKFSEVVHPRKTIFLC